MSAAGGDLDAGAASTWMPSTIPARGRGLPASRTRPPRAIFVTLGVARLGTPVAARGYRLSAAACATSLPVAGRLADLYAGDVVPVTIAAGRSRCAPAADVTATRRGVLLYNLGTLATYLVIEIGRTADDGARRLALIPSDATSSCAIRSPDATVRRLARCATTSQRTTPRCCCRARARGSWT